IPLNIMQSPSQQNVSSAPIRVRRTTHLPKESPLKRLPENFDFEEDANPMHGNHQMERMVGVHLRSIPTILERSKPSPEIAHSQPCITPKRTDRHLGLKTEPSPTSRDQSLDQKSIAMNGTDSMEKQ